MSKKNNLINFPPVQDKIQDTGDDLNQVVDKLKYENQLVQENAIKCILKALDCKDHYTYGHSMRVCYFSLVAGRELGLSEAELKELELASLFHDIGKIGTPDVVLNKPTRLNNDEFQIMKQHPENSYNILKEFQGFKKIAEGAKYHHERYDGRGYPEGLKGEDIPLFARIILITDTFDAMTSTRVYRKGMDYEVAFEELEEFSGSQFDGKLVQLFIQGMRKEMSKNEEDFYIPLLKQTFKKVA
jgi:putative nucleotidyltransferase with HDIG domain